jgi:fumarate hydratase class II
VDSVPICTGATGKRVESDSMGQIEVPADHYWGAQTQRSLIHFAIGDDHMPKAVYHAYGYVKKAAALVNADAGRLPRELADAIVRAADEVITGRLDSEFPLYVWQTGSGTQSNMNVNEVVGNRASQLLGGELGSKLDQDRVTGYVGRSLMLVTALSPSVGYDKAAQIAHKADDEGITLREAALSLGVSAADFDRVVDPETMVGDPRRDLGLTPAHARTWG